MSPTTSQELAKVAAAAFFLALVTVSPGASGQSPCWPRDRLVTDLAARWGESPVGRGMAGAGLLVELFATPDGSGWTLVAVSPDGRACVLAAGHDWHRPAPPVATPPQGMGPRGLVPRSGEEGS